MKEQKSSLIFIVILALTALTAVFLGRVERTQRLGEPGVKVVNSPIVGVDGPIIGTKSVYLPAEIPGFQSTNGQVAPLELTMLPKDTTFGRRLYLSSSENFLALVSVVLMGRDRTSLHKPQYCLTGQGWQITKSEMVSIPIAGKRDFELKAMRLTASNDHFRSKANYVYWFVADGETTGSQEERMWLMAKDLITTGVLQRWAYISYFTVCPPGAEEASFNRLKTFISITAGEIMRGQQDKLALRREPVVN